MRRLVRTFAAGTLCALCAVVVSVGVMLVVDRVYAALGLDIPVPAWIGELFDPEAAPALLARRRLLFALGALAFAPVCEEFLFRGFLQGLLERLTGRTVLSVALTAIAFAAIHFSLYSFLPLVAVSACFSVARIKSGGLAAPVMAHALYNVTAILAAIVAKTAAGV